MRVLFRGGRAYEYQNVGHGIVDCMSRALSAGGYFGVTIKPYPKVFPCKRLDASDMVEHKPLSE